MSIRAIAQSSIHRICTGQIIDGIAMAVKELIENSIDAGSTMIEIRIKDHGGDSVEVADNGCGIDPENYANIDLTSLSSYGFRGEALSALAAMSDLTITTRTAQQSKATKLTFDHTGELQSQEATNGRPGTTVCFKDFYKNIPVRYATLHQNIKREFNRLQFVIQCYALICTNIKFIVFHQTKKGNRVRILQTNGTSLKDNISSIFGPRLAQSMVEIKDQNEVCSLNGYVLSCDAFTKTGNNTWKPTSGNQCQFLFINKRPVDIPKVSKAISDVYKNYFGKTAQQNQPPPAAFVINFELPTDAYDINITPDKRTVMIHQENEIVEIIQHLLHRVIEPTQGAFLTNQGNDNNNDGDDILGAEEEHKQDEHDKESDMSVPKAGETKLNSPGEERANMINSLKQKLKKSGESTKSSEKKDQEPKSDSAEDMMRDSVKKNKNKNALNSDGDLSDSIYNIKAREKSPLSKSKKQQQLAALLAESGDSSEDAISKLLKLSGSANSDIGKLSQSESMDLSAFQSDGESDEVIDDLDKLDDDDEVNRAEQVKRMKQQLMLKNAVTGPSPFFAKPAAQTKQVNKSQDDDDEDMLKNPPVMSIESVNRNASKKSKTFPVRLGSASEGSEDSFPLDQSEYAAFKTNTARSTKFKIDSSASEMESEEEPPVVNLFRQNKQKDQGVKEQNTNATRGELKKSQQENRLKMIEQLKSKKTSSSGSTNNGTNNFNINNTTNNNTGSMNNNSGANTDAKKAEQPAHDCDHDHGEKEVEVIEFTDGNSEMMKKHFDYDGHDDHSDELQANQNEFKRNGYSLDKKGRPVIDFDMSYYTEKFKEKQRQTRRKQKNRTKDQPQRKFFTRMTNSDSDEIERELTKQITKTDFEKMEIVGQFNLGFIIVKSGTDLFIVDQHAADEKYNFEVLQTTTKMNLQKMLKPMDLELSPVDEMIVMDNMEVFRANGFDFTVDEDAAPTQRLKLSAYPFSKNTEFGIQDVHEMIEQLKEQPGKMVRLSRVSAMFASRACRKSVMVGTPLNTEQMKKIIKHMGTMKAPWNCPHGRPTMRHLVDLNFLPGAKPAPKPKHKSAFPIRPSSDSTGSGDSMEEDADMMLGRTKRKRDVMEDSDDDLRDNSKRRRRM